MGKTMILMDGLYDLYGLDGKEQGGLLFLPMLGPQWQGSNKLWRGVRKLWLSSALPGKKMWLGTWTRLVDEVETVILTDYSNTPSVAKLIHGHNPNIRIIVWYHNPVEVTVPIESFDRSYCELWSFDPNDCERYGLAYNPQFYIPSASPGNSDPSIDAFYVGAEKGRGDVLREMKRALSDMGLRCEFDIVGVNAKHMPYADVLSKIAHSKVVVDCLSPWQSGMTLRPLEAMFYSKKLITNQFTIKDMDFYRFQNIYVWGADDPGRLKDFMESPIVDVPETIKRSYGLDGWVERFGGR